MEYVRGDGVYLFFFINGRRRMKRFALRKSAAEREALGRGRKREREKVGSEEGKRMGKV